MDKLDTTSPDTNSLPESFINIAVVGDVDGGKSTLIGVFASGKFVPDNGNGSAREEVLSLKHERESGRTSNVNIVITKIGNKLIRFLDLAGHEHYLGTTIQGLTRYRPDAAILMVAGNRGCTEITKKHLAICRGLQLPVVIVVSKLDTTPSDVMKNVIEDIKRMCKSRGINKKCEILRKPNEQILGAFSMAPHMYAPTIKASLVTGVGVDILLDLLPRLTPAPPDGIKDFAKENNLGNVFFIQKVYQVNGIGTVFYGSNMVGRITRGDILNLGPYRGVYMQVRVKSLHDDQRNLIQSLEEGLTGCVAISLIKADHAGGELPPKRLLTKGLILCDKTPMSRTFEATVMVYHHHTTVLPGYRPILHTANSAITSTVLEVMKTDCQSQRPSELAERDVMRNGDIGNVKIKLNHPQFIYPRAIVVFRENEVKMVGRITKINV